MHRAGLWPRPRRWNGVAGLGGDGYRRSSRHALLVFKECPAGDRLRIQNVQGEWKIYLVSAADVVDSAKAPLAYWPEEDSVWLVTCYPFDAISPGGSLRYVVRADVETVSNIVQL